MELARSGLTQTYLWITCVRIRVCNGALPALARID